MDSIDVGDCNVIFFKPRKLPSISSYLKGKSEKVKQRVKEKFFELSELLDENKLFIGDVSLGDFSVDETETLVIRRIAFSNERLPGANYSHFLSIWNKEFSN